LPTQRKTQSLGRKQRRRGRMEVEYIPAEECLKILDYLLNQPDDIVKEFSNTITF
jgi:hypothetical protein